jgi:hypothetical protein
MFSASGLRSSCAHSSHAVVRSARQRFSRRASSVGGEVLGINMLASWLPVLSNEAWATGSWVPYG